jgi:hypothetical protein
MPFSRQTLRSPVTIFLLYIGAAIVLVMGFRFIFPGETAPLPIFSGDWRLIRGALDLLGLFPALVFSALVVPFGIAAYEDYPTSFSPKFFQRLIAPVVLAIAAAAVYGLVFFLLQPLARDFEQNMRYRGELYRLARERARLHAKEGEWLEASQFIGICDSVWPRSPELTMLRTDVDIHIDAAAFAAENERAEARERLAQASGASVMGLPGQRQPVDAAEALAQGEAALNEDRLYDAHWLATLAERIAKAGSPEAARARRLAAGAWNRIAAQTPTRREQRLYSLYELKRSGYQAMVAGEWIRGFYIFQELLSLTPDDPDAANFLAVCERGTKEAAFFIDEMKVSLGEILTGAVYSLPARTNSAAEGRAVLRIASLSGAADYAYGIGIEYISFDALSRPLFRLEAPYAKFLPITLDGEHKVLVQMRALDRHNSSLRWEPEWNIPRNSPYRAGDAQITLDVSYETFVFLSRIRQGLPNLQIDELFAAAGMIGAVGYVPQVFQAEILNRFGAALYFLPMAIVAIIIGWRFRARSRPRYLFALLLPILPVVFNGMAHLYRSILNTVGIWLILALGFSTAFTVFIVVLAVSFVLSLILLAAQHG